MKWLEGVLMIAGMNNGDNTYEWTDNGSWDLRSFFKSACQIGACVYNKRRAYGRRGLMSCRVDEVYNKGQPVKEASRDYIQEASRQRLEC